MYPRFHRASGALVLLALLVLSGLAAMLPGIVQAQTRQLTGLVTNCGDSTVFIAGATVTLVDADGSAPSLTATTTAAGTYTFSPPAGYYSVLVDRTGYFDGSAGPVRFDGTVTVRVDICLDPTPTLDKVVTVRVLQASDSAPIPNATVEVSYVPEKEVVARDLTNATGYVVFTLWASTMFDLRTNKSGFALDLRALDTTTTTSVTVLLDTGIVVVGQATDSEGNFISAGLQGFLYLKTLFANPAAKVVRASVVDSSYTFNALFGGTYVMVIDANGYRAKVSEVVLAVGPATRIDAVLTPSPEEESRTTIVYGTSDWNNLTIHRNLTLNPDTTLPGLNPPGVRDLGLQVDFTFGEATGRNGLVDGTEPAAFEAWLEANGPSYASTDGFLTTNGKSYLQTTPTDYTVTVVWGSRIWINTTATYKLKVAPPYIPFGASRYFVNVTTVGDSNTSVYYDNVYEVVLPRTYEMSEVTLFGSVTTANFTRVTVDPGVTTSSPQARMTIEPSRNGTAAAKVSGPSDKFHVVNASFSNYQAYVANDTDLTLSAEDSEDPVGDIRDGNFTWRPYANVTGLLNQTKAYGITTTFRYNRSGEFVVNLTVVQAGGNVTHRNITLWVDDQLPVARMRTNRTGTSPLADGFVLKVNEDTRVRFDGAPSTDQAFINATYGGNKTGIIPASGFAWDFDGDNITDATTRIVNWTFDDPGNFTVNLTVTDGVGWKSLNATITALVNDTTDPSPSFDILDPADEWLVTSTLIENKTYSFNASKTTDNFDKVGVLNFTWTIPGPVKVGSTTLTGLNHTFYGANITFTWTEFNSSYDVVLKVSDTGFGSGTNNTGTLSRKIQVGICAECRPDLRVEATTLVVTPTDLEDGASITVTVNVSNRAGRGSASSVSTILSTKVGDQTTVLTTSADWTDSAGPRLNRTIGPGETITLKFVASVTGQGNKTVEVRVFDANEPWTQISGDNRASKPISVRQSFVQTLAFVAAIVGVFAVGLYAMVHRRRVRTGKAQPWRLRRGPREEGEERKPRKEVREEKKRL
jgi:PKD repeat protein